MNVRETDLDRLLADWLELDAHVAPAAPVEAAIAFARAHPRRRDWLAPLRRDAMTTPSRGTRLATILIAATLLVALVVAGAAIVGSLPQPTPQPSPSASAGAGGFRHPVMAGSPVPDELIGEWEETDGWAVWAFYRAGSPICTEIVFTDQDCVTIRAADAPERQVWDRGIVTLTAPSEISYDLTASDNERHTCWLPQGTTNPIERLTWTIEGDTLHLTTAGVCLLPKGEQVPKVRR
ncbi:MAG TPA: hypothetical protein VFM19_04915 [Candidatus Limnocylindria bacterium]|nr:hypothetical protein [Candidatus Limnocylindria bacterium]